MVAGTRHGSGTRRRGRCPLTLLALGAGLLIGSGAAHAQPDTLDVTPGRELAQGWCAGCHDITGAYSELMGIRDYGDPPSFYAVANDLAVTELGLRAFLGTPHARMPDIILSEEQATAIIDYILSLRRR